MENRKKSQVVINQNREDLFRIETGFTLGTPGKSTKNKIIPIENFDINCTPKKITIEKFLDKNGKEMIDMWY